MDVLCLSITSTLAILLLSSCGKGEQPAVSDAATTPSQIAGSARRIAFAGGNGTRRSRVRGP